MLNLFPQISVVSINVETKYFYINFFFPVYHFLKILSYFIYKKEAKSVVWENIKIVFALFSKTI